MAAGAAPRAINLLRGWPAPSLLPTGPLAAAAQQLLTTDPSRARAALLYGPDQGYAPLRDAVARWLAGFYGSQDDPARICITGGASQNLACLLQVYADPGATRAVWMVEPCYHLACRVFVDGGLAGQLRAVPEDDEGVDVEFLGREMRRVDEAPWHAQVSASPAELVFRLFRCRSVGGITDINVVPDPACARMLISSQPTKGPPSIRPWAKTYRHLIYAVPTFANPSGKTMSLARRTALVRLAREHDALIITDDVYDFLHWPVSSSTSSHTPDTAPMPRLVDLDRTLPPAPAPDAFGHAVSNGSFSKIVGPGVRTGWAEGTPRLAHGLSQAGSSRSGGAPSQFAAACVAEYLEGGALQRDIAARLVPAYAARYRTLVDAVKTHLVPRGVELTELTHAGVFGGYFVWLVLPVGLRADDVAAEAATQQLTIAPGSLFRVQRPDAAPVADLARGFRLCFAWEDADALREGVARLGGVIEKMAGRGASGA